MNAHSFQICFLGGEHMELHRSTPYLIPQYRKKVNKDKIPKINFRSGNF